MISRWLAAGMETFPVNPTDDGGLHGNGDRNGLAVPHVMQATAGHKLGQSSKRIKGGQAAKSRLSCSQERWVRVNKEGF